MDAYGVMQGYIKKAKSLGARFIKSEVARIIRESNRVSRVETTTGEVIRAGIMVLCAGAWSSELAKTMDLELPVIPSPKMAFHVDPAVKFDYGLPFIFNPDGSWIRHESGKQIICGLDRGDAPGFTFDWDRQYFEEELWPRLHNRFNAFERLKLVRGWSGLFNLGHAAFFAVGAYTTAILNTTYKIPIIMLLPFSGIAAAAFALVVARPIIHLRGDYLCIVTVGLGEIVRIALINDIFGITGGANGIFGISRPEIFGWIIRKPHEFFYYIWFFVGLTIFIFNRLEYSRFGRALTYLREDKVAAESSGVDTAYYKLVAFVLGAGWAGMVGNIYASKMIIIAPESFSFWESVTILIIVILGGSGSIPGIILGAFLIIGLPEIFRDLAIARMLVFGAAMVLMMIFRDEGIIPPTQRRYELSNLTARKT